MKRLVLISAIVLAGCQTTQDAILRNAMNRDDVQGVERLISSGGVNSPSERNALTYLSSLYASEIISKNDSSQITAENLSSKCFERIKHDCDQDSLKVFQKEGHRRRAIEEKSAADYAFKVKAREQADDDIKKEIDSGSRRITTLRDAQIYFRPIVGSDQIMANPRVSGGDGKYYQVRTYLTGKEGDTLISWWPDSQYSTPGILAGLVMPSPTYVQDGISFGGIVNVVGKYVANHAVTLVSGKTVIVPVFADSYIFSP
jgi:hypothetical protein